MNKRLVLLEFIVLLLFMNGTNLNAQESITHYSTHNGLPHDLTYEIFQDRDGFIWIGTDDGLVKFNGQEFDVINIEDGLTSNFVITIDQLDNGNILLGTWGGGLQLLDEGEVIPLKGKEEALLKINNVTILKNKIYSYYGNSNTFFELDVQNRAYDFNYFGLKNNEWIKRARTSVQYSPVLAFSKVGERLFAHHKYYIENEKIQLFENITGIMEQSSNGSLKQAFPLLRDKTVTALSSYNEGYVMATNDSIFVFDDEKINQRSPINLNNLGVVKIIPYQKDELLLLMADEKGLKYGFIYNIKSARLVDLRKKYAIQSTFSDMLLDHEMNIWLSTYGEGVYMINYQRIKYDYIVNDVLTKAIVKGITQKDDSIYILSNDYVFIFKNEQLYDKIKLSGFGKRITKNKNGDVIVSSIRLDEDFVDHKYFIERAGFMHQDFDNSGSVRVSDSLVISSSYNEVLEPYSIKNITEHRDTLFFATNLGVAFYDTNTNEISFELDLNDRLPSRQITSILSQNDTTLWVATEKGLNRITSNRLETFQEDDGMLSNHINTLFLDRERKLWLGTQKGLSMYNGRQFNTITNHTGLASTYVSSIYEDNNGDIWIGGNKALTIIRNGQDYKQEEPPLIFVKQRDKRFNYEVLSYNRSKVLTTQYAVNNTNWITTTSRDTLDFSEFKKGDYSIQFRAKKEDSEWGYSKKFNFKIQLPWYKEITFIVFCMFCLAFVVYFVTQARLKQVKRKNQKLIATIQEKDRLEIELAGVRDDIARDFHDDMGNKLARISLLSKMLTTSRKSDIENEETLNQIANDASYLYKGTRDFIFSLKHESNNLDEIITYLSDFAEDFFEQFDVSFDVSKNIDESLVLPFLWNRQLVFIFKEAMANTVMHANASHVKLNVLYKNQNLDISLNDDGTGFNPNGVKLNNGLANMQERAKRIGGKLIITSEVNKGTLVKFSGSLNNQQKSIIGAGN